MEPDPTTTIAAAIERGEIPRPEGERLLAHLVLVANGVKLDHLVSHATFYRRLRLARRLGFTRAALGPAPA